MPTVPLHVPVHLELTHRSRYLNFDPCIILASALPLLFMLAAAAAIKGAHSLLALSNT